MQLSGYDKTIATEMGLHAGKEALRAILRIAESTPTNDLKTATTIAAVAYLLGKLRGAFHILDDTGDLYTQVLSTAEQLFLGDPDLKESIAAIRAKGASIRDPSATVS